MKIFILFFIFFHIAIAQEPGEWVVISKKDGFTMYSKIIKDSPIRAMRAHGYVQAPIDKIVTILRDVNSAKSWVPNLIERSYIENISDVETVLYDVTDMPWPVDDRDLVVHHKLTLSEDQEQLILYFKSIDREDKPVPDDRVRAHIQFGKIYFRPMGDKTYVELVILVDPMGSIPKWAVNILQVSMPYDFLMSLNKFANSTELKPLPGIKKLLSGLKPSTCKDDNCTAKQ